MLTDLLAPVLALPLMLPTIATSVHADDDGDQWVSVAHRYGDGSCVLQVSTDHPSGLTVLDGVWGGIVAGPFKTGAEAAHAVIALLTGQDAGLGDSDEAAEA